MLDAQHQWLSLYHHNYYRQGSPCHSGQDLLMPYSISASVSHQLEWIPSHHQNTAYHQCWYWCACHWLCADNPVKGLKRYGTFFIHICVTSRAFVIILLSVVKRGRINSTCRNILFSTRPLPHDSMSLFTFMNACGEPIRSRWWYNPMIMTGWITFDLFSPCHSPNKFGSGHLA